MATTKIDFDALMLGELPVDILSFGTRMGTERQTNFPPGTAAPYINVDYGTDLELLMEQTGSDLSITTETIKALTDTGLVGTVDPQGVVGEVTVLDQTIVIDTEGSANVAA